MSLFCGQALGGALDGIIDTVPAPHDISRLLRLLKTNGKLVLLGIPTEPYSIPAGALLFNRCGTSGFRVLGVKD